MRFMMVKITAFFLICLLVNDGCSEPERAVAQPRILYGHILGTNALEIKSWETLLLEVKAKGYNGVYAVVVCDQPGNMRGVVEILKAYLLVCARFALDCHFVFPVMDEERQNCTAAKIEEKGLSFPKEMIVRKTEESPHLWPECMLVNAVVKACVLSGYGDFLKSVTMTPGALLHRLERARQIPNQMSWIMVAKSLRVHIGVGLSDEKGRSFDFADKGHLVGCVKNLTLFSKFYKNYDTRDARQALRSVQNLEGERWSFSAIREEVLGEEPADCIAVLHLPEGVRDERSVSALRSVLRDRVTVAVFAPPLSLINKELRMLAPEQQVPCHCLRKSLQPTEYGTCFFDDI